jgi:hypothetical protein
MPYFSVYGTFNDVTPMAFYNTQVSFFFVSCQIAFSNIGMFLSNLFQNTVK